MKKRLVKKIRIKSKWALAVKTLPITTAIVLLKLVMHYFGYEFLSLSPLFTAIISANIFLIGFLVSGTLADHKESERLPGDLSSSIEALADEGIIIRLNKNSREAKTYLKNVHALIERIIEWFYKKETTANLFTIITNLNKDFLALEPQTQANFIVRLKQEQSAIRRIINRIQTIRDTSFFSSSYAIAEIITFFLILGLVFIKLSPFYEGMFFVAFISFVLIYMIFFIKDLDNPFGYDEDGNFVEEVSLKPLIEARDRIKKQLNNG